MAASDELTLCDVELEGLGRADVRLAGGRIEAVAPRLDRSGRVIDGHGGALIPGLIDHHLHLFAAAAARQSLAMDPAAEQGLVRLAARIEAAAQRPSGAWIRVTGFSEGDSEPPDRWQLDAVADRHPVRVQHRSGALWILNSLGLERLGPSAAWPPGVEREDDGRATGRIYREDRWLREVLGAEPPDLAPIARDLDAYGIVGITDATATTDASTAGALITAAGVASMRQHLHLMSASGLPPDPGGRYAVGPRKQMIDEAALPDLDALAGTITESHQAGRPIAIHCATVVELAFALAAWNEAGVGAGDRIEHGNVIDDEAAAAIAAAGLTVVSQPGLVRSRGDHYLAAVPEADHAHLFRLASLKERGVRLAGSSDAPYGPLDPWVGMHTAVDRRTQGGRSLGQAEGVVPREALGLYLGRFDDPGGGERKIAPGGPADLCLLAAPLRTALAELTSELVALTIIDGIPID